MKAARIEAFGSPDKLQVVDVPPPGKPGPSDVLVRVEASGVNPIEWKIRSGMMAQALGRPLPAILGWECAGVVEAVGDAVAGLAVGAEVFAYPEMTRDGTHAELVLIDEGQLALKPDSLSFVEAAAVPMSAQAAWSMLEASGPVEGKRVLVHGAGGAVGHWLTQLAAHRGARLAATASGADLARVKALGAEETIEHRQQRFEDAGKFDIVFDLVGGETQKRSWAVLSPGGTLVTIVMPPDAESAKAAGVTGKFVMTAPRGEVLTEIAALIEAGRLKPLAVAHARPLADAAAVHAESEAGTLHGKVVLVVQPD